jgi:hypothetical protein
VSKSKSSVATTATMKTVLIIAILATGLAASTDLDLESFESYQKDFNKVYGFVPFVRLVFGHNIYICLYVCMYVCMYACMYACM